MSDLYFSYLKEREGFDVAFLKNGFITYRINKESKQCYIRDIYVVPNDRHSGIGESLEAMVIHEAKEAGCTQLVGSVSPGAKGAHESMNALVYNGYRLHSSYENLIYFIKEI